jgi:outer membrane receptor protein involved in Fe transport
MRKSIWLLSAGLFAISTPAFAQSTDTDKGAAQPTDGATAEAGAVSDQATQTAEQANQADVGDIVVTATRRNEALSDVPLAVSAITAQTLENSGVTDIRQLTQVSPSLLVSSTSSEAGAGVARIRGVGTVGDNPGLESSVALFIDGVYRSRTGVGLTELGQIERVEVLRGPQGTLFGRNASAGLISVITARPSFTTAFNGELTVGNYDLRRVEVGATGALTSALAVRADAVYLKRDGFLTDVISGRDVNDRDRYLLRLQGLFKPNDDFSFRLIGDYSKRDEECCAASYVRARDNVRVGTATVEQASVVAGIERALGGVINDDTYARRVSITPGRDYAQDVKDYGLSGEAVYDFGFAELTSITAYRYNNYVRGQDVDFNNLDIWYRASDGGSLTKFKTFTQELRLQGSTFDDRLDYLVGGYYAREDLTVRDNLSYGADFERYANCLLAASLSGGATVPVAGANCNATFSGGLTQVTGGIAQVTAGIAQITAIPVAQRTPAQVTQLAALQTQLATLQAQLPTLQLLNANPARPGFGSVAAFLGLPAFAFNGIGLRDEFEQRSRNFALFTHNIFGITDTLKLTVGARYTRERKTLDAVLTDTNALCRAFAGAPASIQGLQTLPCAIPSVPNGNYRESGRRKTEKKLSGTAVLSWKPTPETLTYASYSRGYKAGGFNLDRSALIRQVNLTPAGASANAGPVTNATLATLAFEPEVNDAFELGVKYNGRGLDLNIAVFHQVFDDFQLNTFNGVNFQVENVNSCKNFLLVADQDNSQITGRCTGKVQGGVKSRGVEAELFTRPVQDVSLNFGATFADTRYRNNLVGVRGAALSSALFQLPGERLSNSSLLSATASLSFNPRITDSGIRALFYLDGRHASKFNTGSDLDVEKVQTAYTVVNGRIGLQGPEGRWGVELWAQNLLGEDYTQVAFDAPLQGFGTTGGSNTRVGVDRGFYTRSNQLFGAFLAEPRTYGLTVRTRL